MPTLTLVSSWFCCIPIGLESSVPFVWFGLTLFGSSRDVSSSHKAQILASNVIEESRAFDAIVQLTASTQGSSVVSSGAQFVCAGERCRLSVWMFAIFTNFGTLERLGYWVSALFIALDKLVLICFISSFFLIAALSRISECCLLMLIF